MERLARTASTLVAMISCGALLRLVFFGRPLLQPRLRRDLLRGWIILMILAVGTLWDTASGSAGFVLQMSGHTTCCCCSSAVGMALLNCR